MVYDIEFIRQADGKAPVVALHVIKLAGDSVAEVVSQADQLFQRLGTTPRLGLVRRSI